MTEPQKTSDSEEEADDHEIYETLERQRKWVDEQPNGPLDFKMSHSIAYLMAKLASKISRSTKRLNSHTEQLVDFSRKTDKSTKKLIILTRWLIVWTIILAALTVALLVLTVHATWATTRPG
jgi:hypothetical protein